MTLQFSGKLNMKFCHALCHNFAFLSLICQAFYVFVIHLVFEGGHFGCSTSKFEFSSVFKVFLDVLPMILISNSNSKPSKI